METNVREKVHAFFTQYKLISYKRGDLLIRAGDTPTKVFYIAKGNVREYAISAKGEEIVVNVFKPPAFFPLAIVMNDTPNDYFFEAATDLEIYTAPKQEVLDFIKDDPEILYNILSRVFKGTDGLLKRMVYLMSGNAHARLLIELIIYAKRFSPQQDHDISLHISERDLASQAGLTRETVSREMRRLKDQGLIATLNNTFVIKNLQAMEEAVEDIS